MAGADAFAAGRGRLLALQSRFDAGTIDAARYDDERRAIERELGEALLASRAAAAARPSLRLVGALTLAVLAVAIAGYAITGSPSLPRVVSPADSQAAPPSAVGSGGTTGDARESSLQQIAARVDALAARMKDRPDDSEGWTMLARSYAILGRFGEAVPAYDRAAALQPNNAALLADYADALAAANGAGPNPEAGALVERALTIAPEHPKALALAGTLAFEAGDYAGAAVRWRKLAAALPEGSELRPQVQANIDEAEQRARTQAAGGAGAGAASSIGGTRGEAAMPRTNATTARGAGVIGAAGSSVSGTVSLAAALAGRAAPGDTVFVFARDAAAGRMPLAVLRARVADLPLSFRLDDSMAMAPTATLSGASRVVVGARISKSGGALPQAGDLAGEAAAVAPGASGIGITIDKVVER